MISLAYVDESIISHIMNQQLAFSSASVEGREVRENSNTKL
jgi:hypothetical protein